MMTVLNLSPHDLARIRREGETHYPEECCGFLFGHETDDGHRRIAEVQPIRNEQDVNRARRFLIGPDDFRLAEAHARATGQELLGFYHTHPDHPAVPSEFDREHALPFYSYAILSVRGGRAAELRSWQLDLDREGYAEEIVRTQTEIIQ